MNGKRNLVCKWEKSEKKKNQRSNLGWKEKKFSSQNIFFKQRCNQQWPWVAMVVKDEGLAVANTEGEVASKQEQIPNGNEWEKWFKQSDSTIFKTAYLANFWLRDQPPHVEDCNPLLKRSRRQFSTEKAA